MANSWQLSAQCDWRAWDTAVYHDQCRGPGKYWRQDVALIMQGANLFPPTMRVAMPLSCLPESSSAGRLRMARDCHGLPAHICRTAYTGECILLHTGARSLALVCSPKGAPETGGPSQQRAASRSTPGSGPRGAINQSVAAAVAAFEIPPSSASAPTDCAIRRTARPRKHRTGLQPALTPVLSLISEKKHN